MEELVYRVVEVRLFKGCFGWLVWVVCWLSMEMQIFEMEKHQQLRWYFYSSEKAFIIVCAPDETCFWDMMFDIDNVVDDDR